MRVTELPNPLTEKLDALELNDQIDALMNAEQEIFSLHQWGDSLLSANIIRHLESAQSRFQQVRNHPEGQIILAGAGTSGRIAFFLASLWAKESAATVSGLMAGGTGAFFRAKEGKEDQAKQGATDLNNLKLNSGPKIFVGITCGLSAAYVFGAAKAAIELDFQDVYMIGFNPKSDAVIREDAFLGSSIRTFLDNSQITLLNPILGPEPIAGSTRMKGGTATLIMLQAIFQNGNLANFLLRMRGLHLQQCELNRQFLPKILAHLPKEGFHYEPMLELGFMAVLDASECAPTFGCPYDHVSVRLPTGFFDAFPWLKEAYLQDPWKEHEHVIPLENRHIANQESPFEIAICTKWLTNMISTLYFVQKGKVYGNRMIDLRISNIKLWYRACDLVAEISGVPIEVAEKTIQLVLEGQGHLDIADWVTEASKRSAVVPTALLMCIGSLNRTEAIQLLKENPRVIDALNAAKEKA